jgi:PIN domain nuclease of toxin-antitoxin system
VILLLDAHALLWWLADDPALASDARDAIASPTNEVLVSAASVWEIEIKRRLGKLRAPEGVVGAIASAGFRVMPITGPDAERAAGLPPHHRDPFDRMLIAQAERVDAVVVTRDVAFALYEARVLAA